MFVSYKYKDDMKTEVIQVRVDEDLKNKLQSMADADHRTLADFIRVQLIKLAEQSNKKK